MINECINKLINKELLNETELKESFDEVFSGLATDVQATSFLTLLNQFDDEAVLSALNSANSTIRKPFSIFNIDCAIQNISLKSNAKYFDIRLIQDLICASADLNVSCSCFNSINTKENSFDILLKMGVNIDSCADCSNLEYEKLNFNYFYLSQDIPYFKYSENIRHSLPFENIFDIVSKLLNPLNIKNLFLATGSKNLVEKYAKIALKLGKNNSVIVSGANDFPFVSPNGESYVAEAWKNKIFTYILTPELLGLKEYAIEELKCENNEQNAFDILEIIGNKNKGAKYIATILNSALSLYISKKADSVMDGLNLAKKLIEDGLVLEKFNQIKKFYE